MRTRVRARGVGRQRDVERPAGVVRVEAEVCVLGARVIDHADAHPQPADGRDRLSCPFLAADFYVRPRCFRAACGHSTPPRRRFSLLSLLTAKC